MRATALAQSCTADLAQAQTCSDIIGRLGDLLGPTAQGAAIAIEGALIMNAAELYNRATSGNSGRGERGSIAIHERLTPEQLDDHQALGRLRNCAMAHVYPDEALADGIEWHREFAFAIATDHGWKPGVASNRVQASPATVASLGKIPRRLPGS